MIEWIRYKLPWGNNKKNNFLGSFSVRKTYGLYHVYPKFPCSYGRFTTTYFRHHASFFFYVKKKNSFSRFYRAKWRFITNGIKVDFTIMIKVVSALIFSFNIDQKGNHFDKYPPRRDFGPLWGPTVIFFRF